MEGWSPSQVEAIFEVLLGPSGPVPASWSSRYRRQIALVKSGNPLSVARVARDLAELGKAGQLSAREHRLFVRSVRLLGHLVSAVHHISLDEARRRIIDALA